MVIMESCCLPENSFKDLLQKIERCHLSFLELDESNEKIYQRNKLEEYIHDFLCISEHYHKFTFHETAEVLHLSATCKKDYKAAMGFNAIQMYAGNLLAQPWRREYRQLKTYSGFYQHQVEANLVGADKLFEAMGYRYCGDGLFILDDPICPDRVTAVSMDCLIAYVECQISKAIWDEVCRTFKISWMEVLEFRKNHICSPEQCANALKCRHHQRHYQEQQGLNTYSSVRCQSIPVPLVSQIIPVNHSFTPPGTHHHVGLPLQQEYTLNGTCPRSYPTYASVPTYINNDYIYSVPIPSNSISPGIEIETMILPSYDVVDYPVARTRNLKKSVEMDYEPRNNGTDLKDSQLEDWDYVYKNLESQGYNKDLGERGDLLHPKETKKMKQTNLDDAMNHLSIYDRPLKVSDVPKKAQKCIETPPKEKPLTVEKFIQTKTVEKKPKDEKSSKKKVVSKALIDVKEVDKKWTCKACTFLNETVKDICEMCGKSKNVKEETQIEVGGAECSKCTLVNSKNLEKCEACGTSLAGSPTYI